MKKWFFFLLSVTLMALQSNAQSKILKGSGKVVKKSFTVQESTDLIIQDFDGKIFINLSEKPSLSVSMDDNIIDRFSVAQTKSGALRIYLEGNENGRLYLEKTNISITIGMPSCKKIEYRGNADMDVKGLKNESFELLHTGNGDATFEGKTRSLKINHVGNGDINARKLESSICDVKSVGNGDIAISAEISLKANGVGNGDIILVGPAKIESLSGMIGNGDLRREK